MRNVIVILTLLCSSVIVKAQFEKLIGNTNNNRVGKMILHDNHYYVLGQNGNKATVTKMTLAGVLLWTNQTNEDGWWNDVVVNKDGNLMTVGYQGISTLPNNWNSNVGIINANNGSFVSIKTYNFAFRDFFSKIFINPFPSNSMYPYYVVGAQVNISGFTRDVGSINMMDSNGNINLRRVLSGPDDLEIYHGFWINTNTGDFALIGGKEDGGVVEGAAVNFDKHATSTFMTEINKPVLISNIIQIGLSFIYSGQTADTQRKALLWKQVGNTNYSYTIDGLSNILNTFLDPTGTTLYALGVESASPNRRVLLTLDNTQNTIPVTSARVFTNGESAFSDGFANLASNQRILYTDTRTGNPNSLGLQDGLVIDMDLSLQNCLNGTIPGLVLRPYEITTSLGAVTNVANTPPTPQVFNGTIISYTMGNPCALPCNITLQVNKSVDPCSNATFTGIATGGTTPYSYQWDISCDGVNGTANPFTNLIGPGTIPFCVTVTDAAGCSAVLTNQTVVGVRDLIKPVIDCPDDIQITNNPGQCFATFAPVITVTDNCDPAPVCDCIMTGGTSGNMPKNTLVQFNVGTTTVTCTATDASGNVSNPCLFTVTVLDSQPPSIFCPPNITISCDQNEDDYMITGQATATDNCPGVIIDYTDSFAGDNCSGTITRTWTATDASGTIVPCVQLIKKEDKTPPSFTCPPSNLNPIECTTNPNLGVPTNVMDNCGGKINQSKEDVFSTNGCISTVTRKWTVTDQCGNSDTCVQVILMQDTKPPTFTNCGIKYSVQGIRNPDGICYGNATVVTPDVTDMCDSNVTITNSFNNTSNASGTYPTGQTIVIWTAKDACGLMTMCQDTVVVLECVNEESTFCGWAAATCFSFSNSDPVGVLYDVRNSTLAPIGNDWATVLSIHPAMWNKANIGDVFGITFDTDNNVYFAATSVYQLDFTGFSCIPGPGGFAGIYKTNLIGPNINNTTTFVSTLNANTLSILGSNNQIPNKGGVGNGIGNIAYDKYNNQFFVTNLEDGRIYRINNNGIVLSSFDPFNLDAAINGLCINGESLWGVAVYKDPRTNIVKVYFARSKSGSNSNQIWSIELHNSGTTIGEFNSTNLVGSVNVFSGILNLKLEVDNIPGTESKITDIEFSKDGIMLMAERGGPHSSNVFQYENIGGVWSYKNNLYVGTGSGKNSSGGIDYGYIDASNSNNCVENVWATGNCMDPQNLNGNGCQVYGMQGINPSGNSQILNGMTDIYVDFDGNYLSQQKLQIGDVDIYRCHECVKDSTECNNLFVSVRETDMLNDSTCCYSLTITNNENTDVTSFCTDLLNSPNWIINTAIINNPSYTFSSVGSGGLCFQNTSGIPLGTSSDIVSFCLTELDLTARDTQYIVVNWFKGEQLTECRDTIKTYCSPTTKKDTCFVITDIESECDPENDYSHCVTFTVTNISTNPAQGFIVDGLPPGYIFSDCGCSGSAYGSTGWAFDWFTAPLAVGSSRTVCVKITSALPILDTTKVCFSGSIEGLRECCKSPFPICVDLVPCCTSCDNISIVAHDIENQDSCCYAIDLRYNCDYQYFNSITLDIINPDVHFGSYNVSAPGWSLCPISTSQHICVAPSLSTIFPGNLPSLVTFCLTDIDDPSEVPQFVQIGFNTLDSQGRDSIACDTVLRFECIDKNDPCVFITNEQIECIPDSNKYQITVTIQNISNPDFTAGSLTLFPLSGLSPNPIPLIPPLPNDGSTRTVTFCYTPPVFPDADGKLILVYKLVNIAGDSCCNGNQVILDTLILPECGPVPCGYICDDDDLSNFDVENQTLGALNAPPSGWYKEYNKPTIVADGCNGSDRSLQLAGVTRGYLGEGAGVRINGFSGPVNLLEKGKTYCIKFCAKVLFGLASTSGYLRIRATDGSPLSYGTCLYPSCEIVKDVILTNQNVWDEITVFYTPTQNYTNLVFSNQSISPLDAPSVIRIDALEINSAIPVYYDLTPPTIDCPVNTTITDIDSDCIIQYTIPVVPVSDDNGISTFQCFLDGSPVSAGSTHSFNNSIIHVVSCVAYDVCGNRDSCSYTVTVACDTSGSCCGQFNYNTINPFGFGEFYGAKDGSMDFIDITDDGNKDHIFYGYNATTMQRGLFYRINNGIPGNQFGNNIWFSDGSNPYNFDYNGDGKDDLFFTERDFPNIPGNYAGKLYYRKNLGGGNFDTKIPIYASPNGIGWFAIGDINQDNIADLITMNYTSGQQVIYFEGTGGSFPNFLSGLNWFTLNIPIIFGVPELFKNDCGELTDLYFANNGNLIKYTNLGGFINSGTVPNFDLNNPVFMYPYSSSVGHYEYCVPRFVDLDNDSKTEFVFDPNLGKEIIYFDCDSIPVPASCCKDSLIFANAVNNSVLVGYDSKTCIGSIDISLLDPCIKIDRIDWGYGSPTIGPLATGNIYTHDYTGNSGQKAIIITFSEHDSNGKKCWTLDVEKRIKPECNNQSCKCKSLKVYLTGSKPHGISNLIDCNDTIAIDCPTKTNVYVNAQLQCDPVGCGPNGITYKIYDAAGVLITSGSSSGNSIYNLQLLAGWFDPNGGTYSIVFEGYCGAEKCSCKIFINVPPCPKECLCNDNFTAEVNLGFQYNYLGNCKYTFTPRNLCPKDSVNWTYNGNNIGTTSGIGVLSYSMSNIGLNEVCMEVTRIDVNGFSCKAKYCRPFKYCNITTPPDDPCEEDEIENSDFRNASPGLMNEVGNADSWTLLRGEAYVIQEADSANHISLVSRNGSLTDLLHNSCCLDNGKDVILKEFRMDLSKDSIHIISPGTKLQIFAPKDVTVTDLADMKAEIDLSNLTRSWQTFSVTTFSDPNWKFDNMVLRLYNPEEHDVFINIANPCIELMPVSTEELKKNSFSIYPNPTTGQLTIQFSSPIEQDISLKVLDVLAREVNSGYIEKGSSSHNFSIEDLAGIYIIQLTDSLGNVSLRKVIKIE